MKYVLVLLAVFAFAAPAQKSKKAPDVEVLEAKVRRAEEKVRVDGKVRITGEKPLKGLVLEFAFLSADGEILASERAEVSDEMLKHDDEPVFHAETLNPPGSINCRI